MTLSIKLNNKPKLQTLQMLCDGGLAEKLNKYELTRYMNTH